MKPIFTLTFGLVILMAGESTGQKTGRIIGSVKDRNTQEVVIGATVKLKSADSLFTSTDLEGRFSLSAPVGTYSITVTSIGYEPLTQYNLVLGSGNDLVVSLEMAESRNALQEVVVKFDNSRSVRATDMVHRCQPKGSQQKR